MIIMLLGVVGFLISLYGFYVHTRLKMNPVYLPSCDFSDKISCSAAFSSNYGELLGVPNTYFGMIYFLAVILLEILGLSNMILLISGLATLVCVYLGYILYYKIRSVCLVCTSIYLICLALFVYSLLAF